MKAYRILIAAFILAAMMSIMPAQSITAQAYSAATSGGNVKVTIDSSGDDASIGQSSNDEKSIIKSMQTVIDNYKGLVVGVFGLVLLSCIAAVIILIMKLPASATNPGKRSNAIVQLLVACISIVILGSLATIITLVYNVFN